MWVSATGVAETTFTAYTVRCREAVIARLIVRRVRCLKPRTAAAGQTCKQAEQFVVSAEPMLAAEVTPRPRHRRAVIVSSRTPTRPVSAENHVMASDQDLLRLALSITSRSSPG